MNAVLRFRLKIGENDAICDHLKKKRFLPIHPKILIFRIKFCFFFHKSAHINLSLFMRSFLKSRFLPIYWKISTFRVKGRYFGISLNNRYP